MSTPELSDEERAAALKKATAVRSARRVFKTRLENGEITLAEAIDIAKQDEALEGIRVRDLLQCLRGVGPRRATAVMEEIGIAQSRRIRGLGEHQIASLLERDRA